MNQSIYIYGIVNEPALAASLAETDPDIYAVASMGCSAIVENRPAIDLGELDRESLARMLLQHQQTLERLMERGMQIIPLKLGTFVSSAADAACIIEDGYNLIERIFRETEDAHELEVVVKWSSFADLLQEVVSEGDVQELKREVEARQSSSTEDAIAVGRLIKEKIDRRNAASVPRYSGSSVSGHHNRSGTKQWTTKWSSTLHSSSTAATSMHLSRPLKPWTAST